MSADDLLSRLDGVRAIGPRAWLARCPAHDDGRPSLSVCEADSGAVLLHCFAGCAALDVVDAVGLEWRALFPPRPDASRTGASRRRPVSLRAVARALNFELHVALVLLADAGAGRSVDPARANEACRRIARFVAELQDAA